MSDTGKEENKGDENGSGLGKHPDQQVAREFWKVNAGEKPIAPETIDDLFADIAEEVGTVAGDEKRVMGWVDPDKKDLKAKGEISVEAAEELFDLPLPLSRRVFAEKMAELNEGFYDLNVEIGGNAKEGKEGNIKLGMFDTIIAEIGTVQDSVRNPDTREFLGDNAVTVIDFILESLKKKIEILVSISDRESDEFKLALEEFEAFNSRYFRSFTDTLSLFPTLVLPDPRPLEMQTLEYIFDSLGLPKKPLSNGTEISYDTALAKEFNTLYRDIRENVKDVKRIRDFCESHDVDEDVFESSQFDESYWEHEADEESLFQYRCQFRIMESLMAGKITFKDIDKYKN